MLAVGHEKNVLAIADGAAFGSQMNIEKTNGTYLQYSKKVLNKNYMTDQAKDIIFKSKGLEGLDKLIHN